MIKRTFNIPSPTQVSPEKWMQEVDREFRTFLAQLAQELADIQTSGGLPEHSHVISEVTDLQTTLDTKAVETEVAEELQTLSLGEGKTYSVIELCDDGADWTLVGSGSVQLSWWAASSWTHDDGDGQVPFGYTMLQFTQTNSSEVLIHKALDGGTRDLSNLLDQILIPVYEDPDAGYVEPQWEVRFYTGYPNLTDYYSISLTGLGNTRWIKGHWNLVIPAPRADATRVGNANWASINGIGIRMAPTASQSRMWLGPICAIKNRAQKGIVVLAFDDAFNSTYDEAFGYMHTKGYRGVSFVCGQHVDAGVNHLGAATMSLIKLTHLQNSGWDICSHGYNHLSQQYANLTQIETDMLSNLQWLQDNRFWGGRFYAFPNYLVDSESWKVLAKHCDLARGGESVWEWATPWPLYNKFQLPCTEMNDSVTQAAWRSKLQKLADNRLVGIFTFHDIGANAYYGQISQANFRAFINDLASYDIEVLTLSDIFARLSPHGHEITDIAELTTALAAKADTSHTHPEIGWTLVASGSLNVNNGITSVIYIENIPASSHHLYSISAYAAGRVVLGFGTATGSIYVYMVRNEVPGMGPGNQDALNIKNVYGSAQTVQYQVYKWG